jgi:hypothetical protein
VTEASTVIDRFAPQVRWIVDSLLRSFELEPHWEDDLRQDANILVLSYAGFIRGTHYGILAKIESMVSQDEKQVTSLIAFRLRKDLTQQVSRMLTKIPPSTSIEVILNNDREFDIEDRYSEADLYNTEQANRYLRKYPTLALNALEGLTQEQIAEQRGVTLRTVERHIAQEKRAFLTDTLKRANLVVEGDETMAELEEAYGYVTKVRR